MKIAILGSGVVGQALAARFSAIGHEVCMGTRDPERTRARTDPNPQSGISFAAWYARHPEIRLHPFSEIPKDSELYFNATGGGVSIAVLEEVGEGPLEGKVLFDLANPLDFSQGMPPKLTFCNTDSLGERIQGRFPGTKVVKGLNTLNYQVMVDPQLVPGEHQVFLCGDDSDAKATATALLGELGWPEDRILDLGGIRSSRGTEMLMPFWFSLVGTLGTPLINYRIEGPLRP